MAENDKHKSESEAEHGHGAGRYLVIWGLLLLFTVTTVVTGRMDLHGANLPLALVIATIKATLVLLFFMHLWDSEGINRLVFSVSIVFVLVLLLGVFGDLWTRLPEALPPGAGLTGLNESPESPQTGRSPAPLGE